jgi:hypothetical protein
MLFAIRVPRPGETRNLDGGGCPCRAVAFHLRGLRENTAKRASRDQKPTAVSGEGEGVPRDWAVSVKN